MAASTSIAVAELLASELIFIIERPESKEKVLERLVEQVCKLRGIADAKNCLHLLLEREKGISTTLDTGLSLPHARIEGLSRIAATLALLPGGLPDPKQPELAIKAVFLFFAPQAPETFTTHLQFLRQVSLLFQADFLAKLAAAPSPAAVLELIRRKEKGR